MDKATAIRLLKEALGEESVSNIITKHGQLVEDNFEVFQLAAVVELAEQLKLLKNKDVT